MHRKIIGIFVCVLMISSVLTSVAMNVEQDIIKERQISVIVAVESYDVKSSDQGDEILVENFGKLLVPGKPNLPSKIFTIAIPPGAKLIDVSIEATESIALEGTYDIMPVPLPRVIGDENPDVYQQELNKYNENFNEIYSNNELYPSAAGEFVRKAGYRKYNLVDVRINPFSYNPVSGGLIFYPEIKININYKISEDFTIEDAMVDSLAKTEKLAEKIIFNYDEAKDWYPTDPSNRESYDYVIITIDSLTSSVQNLVNWEESKGRDVNVVTTSWINSNYAGYDLAEKIRNFLRDKYPSSEWGIEDVLLVGHYDDVPMRRCWQDTGYGKPETDYYYAELSLPDSQSWDADEDQKWGEDSDPIDFYAEVNVGRIPWSDSNTVEHICEKSAAYEQNNDPSFKKNILLLGAFFWPNTDNAVLMEAKVDQEWMSDWTMTRMYEDAQSSYSCDYDLSYSNVKDVWSAGSYAFVDWAGHGSPTACYEYYPSQAFVNTQTCNSLNDDYPAIIFADACSNSDTDHNNIGQMMMKQGAIGFLGSTKVAYGMPGWNEPSDGSSQSLDYFFTTCCTSVEYTQGQAHQWALLEMYTNDLWYYTKFEMFEWGALWGNPNLAMGVASSPPKTPTKPEGPEEWAIDIEATFTSSTTDPDGDNIDYLFDWGDGTDSGWVGPYGSGQTGQASHAWTELGEFQVKAMARDQYGVLSEWSEPATIKIVENDPPEKPTKPEGPEEWYMDVEATFTSSTTDPDGNSIDYLFDWGDGTDSGWVGPYGSGQTGQASHAWTELGEFQVKAMARDQYGVLSEWSEPATIKIVENDPPEKPTISGPKTGTTHKGLKFKFVSTDPEGHNLYYMIHWGDGHYTPYTGPYPSGKEVTFTHSWNEVGDYTIVVKVRDEYGAKSPQNSTKLRITKNRAVTNPVLIQLLENLMDHFPLLERLLDLL